MHSASIPTNENIYIISIRMAQSKRQGERNEKWGQRGEVNNIAGGEEENKD